ncbi:Hsp70 family protein [Actinocrispum sp. NPDC049592]|uniref:Hsp70 family protein n=1 Tax=Actinocrispum sp. NPDC049592 TaxID=3154835 RepID=UPI0034306985
MPYVLGIDVGTSRTAAAVSRQAGSTWGDAEIAQLGERAASIPTVVYFAADGTVLVGDAAHRHATSDPANAARGFARRIGDEVPLMVAGESCTAEALTAVLVRWVADEVTKAENMAPEHIVLTHPADWGSYRKRMLHRALRQANLDKVTLLPEPIAVGESHAASHDVVNGQAIAVYDLGAGALSCAVVRRSPLGTFELLTSSESVEPNGGDSFDDVIFDHVRAGVDIDMADPDAWATLARLRELCTAAKEFLTTGTQTAVREIEVTRAEFEDKIRTAVEAGIEELLRTIQSAPVRAEDLASVVLTGGSSRIPLVTELIVGQLRNQVVLFPEPDQACALGAAIAAQRLVPASKPVVIPDDPFEDAPPPDRPEVDVAPLDLPRPRSFLRLITGMKPAVLGAAGAAVLAAGVALTLYLRPDPPAPPAPAAGTSTVVNSTSAQQTGEGGR